MVREEVDSHLKLDNDYDVVIVGGGIVGAGIFRELSLHGVKTLIVDREDFASQTSQGSSKMLHGGIRYLENMDFYLVFEALKEKNLWLKIAPHISKEIPFYLPIYKESKWPLFFMRIGLFLYDFLSLFKNSPHKILNKKKTLQAMPGLREEGLVGSGMYYDGVVDDSKLTLDCIYDGLNNEECHSVNYSKVTNVTSKNNSHQITLENKFNKSTKTINAKHVVMATGPFTDQVMKSLNIDWEPVLLPSKGTHLWLKEDALPIEDAMVLQTKDQRIIFVIPQRHAILVGTTETPLKAEHEMINIKPTPDEIEYLLNVVNEYFPKSKVGESEILSSFSGVRPLVKSSSSNSSKTSRKHKVYEPRENMHVIVGGKYTTFRTMAHDVNKKILKSLGKEFNPDLTLAPLKVTSIIKNPFDKKISKEDLLEIIKKEQVMTREDLLKRRLSLPSLSHIEDSELERYLNELEPDLKSIRETKM